MPAIRSRTERWRDCLWNIYERGGGIELAVDRPGRDYTEEADDAPRDLLWRVRMLGLSEDEILCEAPGALGTSFTFGQGQGLIGIMAVGQNRWTFRTSVLGQASGGPRPGLRLRMPERVDRCQRRSHARYQTLRLSLPTVRCYPLLDPASTVAAEIACRARIETLAAGGEASSEAAMLPEVGTAFQGQLSNIGGGGVGLVVDRSESRGVEGSRLYWLLIDLRPDIPAPIGVTARLAHSHMDSEQQVHVGMAFEFGLNPSHRAFVIAQIQRFVQKSLER